jgi:3-hydroxybutyryl-CoA dehydrogenase
MSRSVHHVSVLGAGVLGSQIAWHTAFKGKAVVLYDKFDDGLDAARTAIAGMARAYGKRHGADAVEAAHARLTLTTDLAVAAADAELVIETVPEIPDVKREVYRTLAPLLGADTLLATNSSTLLPRDFAEDTGRPDKYGSLHFANRIWATNLVEIMGHAGTSVETLEALTRFGIEIGMVPIPVGKEQNGYVLNTWLGALLQSSMSLVVNGVCTPEDVDRTYLIANRGARVGPFGMIDVIGIPTAYNITRHWAEADDDDDRRAVAAYLKREFLERGDLGVTTGRGFYEYPRPAFAAPDFLGVPDLDAVSTIAARARLDVSEPAD